MPALQKRSQVETRLDFDLEVSIGRSNQDELVAEQVAPGCWLDQMPLLQVIHPVEVGGYEDIGWRTGFDLLGQRRACCVRDFRVSAALLLEELRSFVEGIGQAGGGEHNHVLRTRGLSGSE